MNFCRPLAIALLTLLAWSGIASSQEPLTSHWQKLKNEPTFNTDSALLLTDGTVMMHQYNSTAWWRLTPDINGSYVNGTWSALATMNPGYQPLYFASAVLPDGRVIIEGGEYNNLRQVETNEGAIYDPVANKWTIVDPPSGWLTIGDSPGIVQADGTFMLGQGGQPSEKQAILDATTLTWTAITGSNKADGFSEEGFALLPDTTILTVDCEKGTNSERYNTSTQQWVTAGSTLVALPNSGGQPIVPEMGPLMQRPDGTVVAFGATTHTSIYTPSTNSWTVGPDFPNSDDMADGPASLLPDGNVLVYTSPGVFSGTGSFYEFTASGDTFVAAPATASSGKKQSWQARQLLLPTGQVLWAVADGATKDVELYSSPGTINAAWRPTITAVTRTLTHGNSYVISGTQFNGLSAASAYGDDAQSATSYPLVRIMNLTTKHVFYARTHDHSTMGIATGSAIVSTTFDVPAGIETGASGLFVVANGIPSKGVRVTIN